MVNSKRSVLIFLLSLRVSQTNSTLMTVCQNTGISDVKYYFVTHQHWKPETPCDKLFTLLTSTFSFTSELSSDCKYYCSIIKLLEVDRGCWGELVKYLDFSDKLIQTSTKALKVTINSITHLESLNVLHFGNFPRSHTGVKE